MWLLVGLGNPGPEYAGNRHNIGFMAVDEIVRRHGFSPWRRKFQGEISEGRIGPERAIALKPLTYMNESGRSVAEAARFHKIEPGRIVVFHDELDLAPSKMRVKTGGGHAGHNGLRDITRHMGADFVRVRLGIGHPGDKARVHGWVLGDFARAEQDWLRDLTDAVAVHLPLLLAGRESDYMSKVAGAVRPPKPLKPAKPAKPDAAGAPPAGATGGEE
ncbi:MAG: aminoacyl-tRNA hydrolase [Tistrella sp.]|jgi:PTH1 family peptidyl-tRNA hydrolase|uniref:Peptidyl-tRNA hydrolase n=2 Tax=Tistrella mobilis TaxID=171437 RepID=A0A162M1D4_9PROT|nr:MULTISPECIES: aminoacyl-tRNA hydrolase [Tistrella]KYO57788.1 peptidyl-tRNA hydrolase [Tistrella mobilis]MAD39375.1 aminoacyl-tRNA hydrolase [Tistrella sp.]MBA76391.1 aminoacyl-tRNA hydrolase [Tistrella sp.]